MPLQGFESLCKEYQKIIVSKDQGSHRKHTANNTKHCRVNHYKIDDVVIKVEKRCDFLLINEDTLTAYLIELKGSDLTKAVRQLESTEKVLAAELSRYDLQFRIVCSKSRTQEVNTSLFMKYKHNKGSTLKHSTHHIDEDI